MRIDSHQHFWRYNAIRDAWITDSMSVLKRDYLPAQLEPELRSSDVDATIAVQADQSEEETLFLLDLAERNPFIAGVVGWVDLLAPNLEERLAYFSQFRKLRGFRHVAQSEPDDHFLAGDDFVRGVRALSAFKFTYDILIYPKQLPAAVELAQKLPHQPFVLDHIAKPEVARSEIAFWAAWIQKLAAQPNVLCKLSGLITEADWRRWSPADFEPYFEIVFEAFGVDRLMSARIGRFAFSRALIAK